MQLARIQPWLIRALPYLFVLALIARFALVFLYHPLDHLFSDPGRHWGNGKRFFTPDIMGSIDPLMYQAWLYALQQLSGDDRAWVALATGGLSVAMALFWYLALKELLPRNWALGGGLAIALMPSLTMIYGYTMNETLLLPLMAGAVWLSLRAMRTKTFLSAALAGLFWALACYTRSIALVPAAIFMLAIFITNPQRIMVFVVTSLCFLALMVPACWHSMLKLKYCAPFGQTELNEIYRGSRMATVHIQVMGEGEWFFSSPSLYHYTFAPWVMWKSTRSGKVDAQIYPENGRAGWVRELKNVAAMEKPMSAFDDWAENAAYLWFGPSWPDNNPGYWLGLLNIWNRWLWLPVTVAVAMMLREYKLPWRQRLLPLTALLLMTLLTFQQVVIMEGRYRKPVEPLLIASLVLLMHAKRRQLS